MSKDTKCPPGPGDGPNAWWRFCTPKLDTDRATDYTLEIDRLRAERDDARGDAETWRQRHGDARIRAQMAEAERDRLAERLGEVVSVCNRANKMMCGEMIVYVSDIRAAVKDAAKGGEHG